MSCQKRIRFHRASSNYNQRSEVVTQCNQPNSDSSGDEVREYYESIISNSASHNREDLKVMSRNQVLKYCTRTSNQKEPRMNESQANNHLLKLAQDGDLKGLEKLFKNEDVKNIDATDGFQWTALMCAACSGHTDVVKFLLQRGAYKELTNSNGETAYDLAKIKNCKKVMRLFESWDSRSNTKTNVESCKSGKMLSDNNAGVSEGGLKKFFCVVCARTFKDTTPSQHRTSTIHLFNKKPKQSGTWYHLNENNKGFQMLLKDGWNKDKGLGPEGKEGLKFPVKTVLKRDRKCLGAYKNDDSVPRVTHFKAFDQRAVKRAKVTVEKDKTRLRSTTISKRNLRKQKQKEKEWEIDFRRSFNLE